MHFEVLGGWFDIPHGAQGQLLALCSGVISVVLRELYASAKIRLLAVSPAPPSETLINAVKIVSHKVYLFILSLEL